MVSSNIITIAVGALCIFLGYFIDRITFLKNKQLARFVTALKKRKPIIFLETDKGVFWDTIEKFYRNLGVTSGKELVIVPRSSTKPVLNLTGGMIAHGDLYKAVTVPQELRMFIFNQLNAGWSQEDIAHFIEEIETKPPEAIKEYLEELIDGKNHLEKGNPEDIKTLNNPAVMLDEIRKKAEENKPLTRLDRLALAFHSHKQATKIEPETELKIYINLPSIVKDFIYTGLNRVTIHDMLHELVYQRELEKMGGRNWIAIAIAIVLIIIGIGIGARFILGTPAVANMFSNLVQPARIAP